jgi:hypothetical protein
MHIWIIKEKWKKKKHIVFLLVEIRIATQRDSYHCFHVQMGYIPCFEIPNCFLLGCKHRSGTLYEIFVSKMFNISFLIISCTPYWVLFYFISFNFNFFNSWFLLVWTQIFYFFYSFIHMCIHCLGHFSTLLPSPTLSPLLPSVPGRSCSALITNFVVEKTQA